MRRKRLHHWGESLTSKTHQAIKKAVESLKWAWETDETHPESYPLNTRHAFAELARQIKKVKGPTETRVKSTLRDLLARRRPPTCFSELISEGMIKDTYEYQNADSYQDALKSATSWGGTRTFHKILKAVQDAYYLQYFDVYPRKSKNQFLHRELLDIADLCGISDLPEDRLAEFFDEVCPCCTFHNTGAIAKLRRRWKRMNKPRYKS